MIGLLGRLLQVRGLSEPDLLRRAQLLVAGGLATVVYMVAVAAEGIADRNVPLVVLPAAAGVLAAASIWAAKGGRLARSEALTALVILFITVAVIAVQGVIAVRLSIILVCTMYLGLALRPWMVPAHVAVSTVLVLGAVWAQRAGFPIPIAPSHQPAWIGVVRQILFATVIVGAYSRGARRLLDELARHTTRLTQAHVDLVSARARLEALVAKRSAEIARANTDLEAFAAAAAHDLRAPLRHVQGFLDLFATDAVDLDSVRLGPILQARDMAQALSAKVEAILARDGRARARSDSGPFPTTTETYD